MNEDITARPSIEFHGKKLYVKVSTYQSNGNTALEITDGFGTPYLTASVNLEPLNDPSLVYIKDYSENRGIAAALRRLIEPTGESRRTGFVSVAQYRLGETLLDAGDIDDASIPTPTDQPAQEPEPEEKPEDEEEPVSLSEALWLNQTEDDDMPADATAGVPDPEDEPPTAA